MKKFMQMQKFVTHPISHSLISSIANSTVQSGWKIFIVSFLAEKIFTLESEISHWIKSKQQHHERIYNEA